MQLPDGEAALGWDDTLRAEDPRAFLSAMEMVDVGGQRAIDAARRELEETRNLYGPSGRSLDAFNRLVAAYKAAGRRIDELECYEPDEAKRFFRSVAQGANGHSFWLRGRDFRTNTGSHRRPLLWWWEHLYGSPIRRHELICGQPNCINPRHARELPQGAPRIYPEHVIIGALQVWALHHGCSPSSRAWDGTPSHMVIKRRFGTWSAALSAAGLAPITRNKRYPRSEMLASLRFVRDLLGHWPSYDEFRAASPELETAELPRSPSTIRREFGRWADGITAAKGFQ